MIATTNKVALAPLASIDPLLNLKKFLGDLLFMILLFLMQILQVKTTNKIVTFIINMTGMNSRGK